MTELPDDAQIMDAVRATWPPSGFRALGPFDLPVEQQGTRRATAVRLRSGAVPTSDAVAAVEAARQNARFATRDGAEDGLADILIARGYEVQGASDLMAGPIAPLLNGGPTVKALAHWPPNQTCNEFWRAHGHSDISRAPMYRAEGAKTAFLLEIEDQPAGALFVAIHDQLAILHVVLTSPQFRRRGVAQSAIRHAAIWADANGATHLGLPVEADNSAATALYRSTGLVRRGGYRYWSKDD